jgi:NADPH:quinone reductase-like Zn-dependent oxidoreductase
MRAALQHRYGSLDVVTVEDVPVPEPTGDQVLVRVLAASVNRADLDGIGPRWAFIRLFAGLRQPRSPWLGLDLAGVVEATGPDVTRWKAGDRVFADVYGRRTGAFAEYACAREGAFAAIPEGMDFETAATLPHSAVLALQGLRRRDGRTINPGHRVLVDGASGNVGPFAVQIAKAAGAHVTGTCRGSKVDFVRSLGADEVIDYATTDYTRAGQRYDWILEVDAHRPLLAVRRALSPNGVHVSLGGTFTGLLSHVFLAAILSRLDGRRMGLLTSWAPFRPADVEAVLALVASGSIRPVIDRRFPLAEVVEALRWVDDGHARGKVLVIP